MDNNCILNLQKMYFQNISFERIGDHNNNDVKFQFETDISKRIDEELYRVALTMKGTKEQEYCLAIKIIGIFSMDSAEEYSEEFRNEIITKNTVAILMPYLRSEVSLLTAQPETECVVMPPFNINAMIDDQ